MIHDGREVIEPPTASASPRTSAGDVHTLWQTDEYRNVWRRMPLARLGHDGVKEGGVSSNLLKKIKRHSDPVLRHYGWTVKHLQESVGGPGGMCFHDGQGTADITLQLRERPSKQCNTFRPFGRVMGVMLHEMTIARASASRTSTHRSS